MICYDRFMLFKQPFYNIDIEMRDQILTTSYWLHVKLGKSI
jgi:hypothetical protein